ncbi:LysR substrate-binding domain-containing protein [Nitrogeniibacter aestuarii]|uniref:LysR substrate-binding domain-containing protein n=1 Tax=Nitrogeniibacter aestuarii TaxID=2815343 RepID=UPI001E368692|nr:LysR substrate-binding domain-containing protein [Nitrogeniibacter aestuarii]
MEFRHLRYFVAVAEELSFTRAAKRLHMAQPPLSMQIRALEEELGVVLFERSQRKVRLSPAGQVFFDRARQLLADAALAADAALLAARGERGHLRVGFTSSLPYSAVFSQVIRRYREAFPHVDLQLEELFTDTQFKRLQVNSLDVGLVRSPASAAPDGIDVREIWHDPVCIVMPDDHPLSDAPSVGMAQLAQERFVTFPSDAGTGLPRLLAQTARAAGFEAHVVQLAREATTQIGLVAAGVGLALLPMQLSHVRVPGVTYKPLDDVIGGFPLSVAVAQDRRTPVVDGFLGVLDAVVNPAESGSP